jgi:hypothetical protein
MIRRRLLVEVEEGRPSQPSNDAIIQRGQDAWNRHKTDATWNGWLAIGAALAIGRADAMVAANTNQPQGTRYRREFGSWLAHHHFDDIDKGDRHRLFAVMDNRAAIEAWLATLTLTERLRLNHPNSVWRKWQAATKGPKRKPAKPTLRDQIVVLKEENTDLAVRL